MTPTRRRVLWAIFLDKMTRIARNQSVVSAIAEEGHTKLWQYRGDDGVMYLKIENPSYQQPADVPWHNISSVGFA